jgi:peptidoglycan hydrolase-like protein with peptidoglycan-binding domain
MMPGIALRAETGPSKDARGVLPAGTRLLSYEIISVLGQGGFGITYLAHDTTLDCRVAIKEYLPISLAVRDGGMGVVPRSAELYEQFVWGRERFLAEARTLGKLGQVPAIAHVHDFLEANDTAYQVMALAKGETLHRRLLRDKCLPRPIVERLLCALLEGLGQVHATGLLHHNIKPANIIVDPRGNPTLIDFGAARAAMAGRTAVMTISPGYAAAEQFTSARQGPWTDIYGLSATLYHAITGVPPPSVFDRMLDDGYEPLTQVMPAGFDSGLLVGIDAGLRVRPSERPQSIGHWRSILPLSGPLDEPAAFVMRGPSPAVMRGPSNASVAVAPPPVGAKRAMAFWIGLAAAVVAAVVLSDATVKLTGPPTEAAGEAYRPAVAELQRPSAQDDAMVRQAAAKKTEIVAAAMTAAADKAEASTSTAMESKPIPDADARQSTEGAEAALNLSDQDRKRVQAALSALGYDVPATGSFGPITRAAITVWQKTQGLPVTGFLDQSQVAALSARAAPAEREAEQTKPDPRQAEAALNLSEPDRKRVQAALTALGHEVPTTGYFGPITRGAITAWQKTQGLPATGFLDQAQLAALGARAAPSEQAKPEPQQGEAALNLSDEDRKRVQAALTTLGQEVPTTGYFGPITRGAITAWQKAQELPATGFLDQAQLAALSAQATTAEQTKLETLRAEAALSEQDRKRVQAALTAVGQEVPTTGYFGPITRGAITAWQKTQGLPATGYLTDAQLAALQQQAAAALAKYDQALRQVVKDTPENQ